MKSSSGFRCQHCKVPFTLKKNCTRHEQRCGKDSVNNFQCIKCLNNFSRKDGLIKHIKQCDGKSKVTQSTKEIKKSPCLVNNCNLEFFRKDSLIQHLESAHSDVITLKPKVMLKFATIAEFNEWKEKEEEETYSYFVTRFGQTSAKTKLFYCQHDGPEIPYLVKGMRTPNLKGKIRIGNLCIAKMKITFDGCPDSSVFLEYYPTHNHCLSPQDILFQPLPKDIDRYISDQINSGTPVDFIHDSVKNMLIHKDSTGLRASRVSRKVIVQRARKVSISKRFHENDAEAIFLKTNHLIEEDNCILLYKPIGADVVHGPQEIDGLPNSQELFMLGIQTDRQLELMKQHGSKILVVDETGGTNHFKYQLLTCLIVDDNIRGWPVAHLITNKSDAQTLKYFFQAIKETGQPDLDISCVITGDDNTRNSALINAMTEGFGKEFCHILCKWHIIENWKEKLKYNVSKEYATTMIEELKELMNSIEIHKFNHLCKIFFQKYENNPHTSSFMSYFQIHYMSRCTEWAMCHRAFPHASVNTIGHVESFHSRLKKYNRRLDDLVDILLNVDDYCTHEREALEKFSLPEEILKRHEMKASINNERISQVLEDLWEINMGNKKKFIIERLNVMCEFDHCFCRCDTSACHGLCSHLYHCSCPDAHPLCEHIHKLHSSLSLSNEEACSSSSEYFYDEIDESEDKVIVQNILKAEEDRIMKCSQIRSSIQTLQEFDKYESLSDSKLSYLTKTLAECVHKLKNEEIVLGDWKFIVPLKLDMS